MLNTVTLSQFTDLVKKEMLPMMEQVQPNALQLYKVDPSIAEFNGEFKRYDEVDVETFANFMAQGDDATKADAVVGYNSTMTARRYGKEIDITFQMRRFNKYPEVTAKLTSLAGFIAQRRELDLTHRLTFCTATSYTDMDGNSITITVGDGLALVSAVHTLTESSTTYSNIVTGNPAFSKGGLELAEGQANTQIMTNFAERRVMDFNTIVTGDDPTTVNDVKQFLNSTSDVDQNNPSVMNVYYRKYAHVILPRLATTASGAADSTKAKYWFLLAKGQWTGMYGEWEAVNFKYPAPGNNLEDGHNDNWTYGTRGTYGITVVAGKGLLHSTGLGA